MQWYKYRILNKLLRYLQLIDICINKHGKALSSISAHTLSAFWPYAWLFSKQTDEKNPCWAVFSIIFKTGIVSCTDFWAHKQDTRQYSQLSLSGHLSKADTSLRRTANLVPDEFHLFLCNWTLSKADTSLRRTADTFFQPFDSKYLSKRTPDV